MAAAERFDLVIDFSAYPVGTAVTLRNDLGVGSTASVKVRPFDLTPPRTDPQVLLIALPEQLRAAVEAGWSVGLGCLAGRRGGFQTIRTGPPALGPAFDPGR